MPFYAMFPVVVTVDWRTTDPHASERGSYLSSMSIHAHRECRKPLNPQSPFLLEHGNPTCRSNLSEGASVLNGQKEHSISKFERPYNSVTGENVTFSEALGNSSLKTLAEHTLSIQFFLSQNAKPGPHCLGAQTPLTAKETGLSSPSKKNSSSARVSVQRQRILFGGQNLTNQITIEVARIQARDVLHIVLAMRAGFSVNATSRPLP
jgi:hypothetical protein